MKCHYCHEPAGITRQDRNGRAIHLCGPCAGYGEHSPTCPHPAARLYAWYALDGTLCIACSDCGAILKGGTP